VEQVQWVWLRENRYGVGVADGNRYAVGVAKGNRYAVGVAKGKQVCSGCGKVQWVWQGKRYVVGVAKGNRYVVGVAKGAREQYLQYCTLHCTEVWYHSMSSVERLWYEF
jgi:hypothetical protein